LLPAALRSWRTPLESKSKGTIFWFNQGKYRWHSYSFDAALIGNCVPNQMNFLKAMEADAEISIKELRVGWGSND